MAEIRKLLEPYGISEPVRRGAVHEFVTAGGAVRRESVDAGAELRELSDAGGCIHTYFEAQAARTPDAIALQYEDSQLTYGELNARANVLAHRLAQIGVGPDVLVGLYLERSLEIVVGILGVLKAGGAYVPLAPDNPPQRLQLILEDAAPRLIITHTALRDGLPTSDVDTICVDEFAWDETENRDNPGYPASADDLAYVLFTSGSTGQPKGVQINHSNVVRLLTGTDTWFDFGADDVWALVHSFAFDASVWELWGALLHGGKAVIVPTVVARSTPAFYSLLHKQRVTVLCITASAFYPLIDFDKDERSALPLALRYLVFIGEALEFRRLKPWFARHGDAPAAINMYGPTETTVYSMYYKISKDMLDSGCLIGVPIPGEQIHLLDEARMPVPQGTIGEIYVGGCGVARGYLNRPDLTTERFIADPFSTDPSARLYKTGDRGRMRPDGQIEFCGRVDYQVKLRGYRIELGEVEAALNRCPGVTQGVVVLRDAPTGDKELVGYFLAEPRGLPSPTSIRTALVKMLPAYMVPSAFVAMLAWPLNLNRKLDRPSLPAPRREHRVDQAFAPPRTKLEADVAEIWAKHLRVAQVGIHDDFFDLGGHSLIAAAIFSDIRARCGATLPLALLFRKPTVAELAQAVVEGQSQPGSKFVLPVQPEGGKPPIVAMLGICGSYRAYAAVARALGEEQPFYGLQAPGLDDETMPRQRIEEVADSLHSDIDEICPDQPFVLMGACAGALVAFELAQRLSARGRKIAQVIMINPSPIGAPNALRVGAEGLWRRLVLPRFLLRRCRQHLAALVTLKGHERRAFIREKLAVIREMISRRDLLRESRQEVQVARLLETTEAALEGYRPQHSYDGRVALLLGDLYSVEGAGSPVAEWRPFCTGSLEVAKITGKDTGIIVRPPHLDVLVSRLKPLLGLD